MPRLIALLILLLHAAALPAVTCDFDYQLTPPPHGVGLRIMDHEAGTVLIWYPAEVVKAKQITDERDPDRMGFRDYLVAAHYGSDFRNADIADRARYLKEKYQPWYDNGARHIQVSHMLVAIMHAHLNAPALPAKAVIIGTVDPILAERLAGHGLVVVNLQSSLMFQSAEQRKALSASLEQELPKWLGKDVGLKRALIIQEPMENSDIVALADATEARAVIINHRLSNLAPAKALPEPVLAFQTDDTPAASREALAALAEKSLKVVTIPELETALLSAAPYEACARMAFSSKVYQGLHLHHRRILIVAEMLDFLNKRLDLDLALSGTNGPDRKLESQVGLKRSTQP